MMLSTPRLLTEKAFVGGQWISADNGRDVAVINPSTRREIGKVPRLGAAEVTRAIEAAAQAFPAWSRRPAHERSNILRTWASLMLAHRDDLAALCADVAQARREADLVIVSLHWGIHFVPAVIADYQREVAHAAIDAGAELILGHHAHILKGVELYRGKAIFYSLGNLLFDNLHSTKRLHGILHLHFRKEGSCLDRAVYFPTVTVRPRFTPKPAGKEFEAVATRLQTLSTEAPLLATPWTVDDKTDSLTAQGACE
jgi:hypothetical protein